MKKYILIEWPESQQYLDHPNKDEFIIPLDIDGAILIPEEYGIWN